MQSSLEISAESGVTLIELITVMAIMAILLAVAVPSFTSLMYKKRVENALITLATDLQYARSEAVQRNTSVSVTFGTGCYVIHTVGSTGASCTQSGTATVASNAVQLKLVQLEAASTLSFNPNNTLTYLMFDSVRGMATWDGSSPSTSPSSLTASNPPSGSVDVTSSAGPWQLRASVTSVGRARTCSPNSSISGYQTCA